MKKAELKSLRKTAQKDLRVRITTELKEITGKIVAESKKVNKEISRSAKRLAKKMAKNIVPDQLPKPKQIPQSTKSGAAAEAKQPNTKTANTLTEKTARVKKDAVPAGN